MTDSLPSFVVPVCVAAGVLLVAAGVPLCLRRIPPNPLYGVRLASTRRDDRAWYDVNAQAGRDFIVIGILYLLLLALALRFGQTWIPAFRVLVPLAVLVVGLMVDTITLGRAASRFSAEHKPPSGPAPRT